MDIKTAKKSFGTHFDVNAYNDRTISIVEVLGAATYDAKNYPQKIFKELEDSTYEDIGRYQSFETAADAKKHAASIAFRAATKIKIARLPEQNVEVFQEDLTLGKKVFVGWDLGNDGIHLSEYKITSALIRPKDKWEDANITHQVTCRAETKDGRDYIKLRGDKEGVMFLFEGPDKFQTARSLIGFASNQEAMIDEIRGYLVKKSADFEQTLTKRKSPAISVPVEAPSP